MCGTGRADGVDCRSVAGKVDRDECDGSRCETSSSECGACSATNTAGCASEAACLDDIAQAQRRYADVTEREQSALRSLLELRDDEALNVSTRAGVEADTDEGKLFQVRPLYSMNHKVALLVRLGEPRNRCCTLFPCPRCGCAIPLSMIGSALAGALSPSDPTASCWGLCNALLVAILWGAFQGKDWLVHAECWSQCYDTVEVF